VGRVAAGAEKPVLASLISGEVLTLPAGVANFDYPESAGRALGIAAARAGWLRRPAGSTPVLEGIDRDAARTVVASALEGREEAWLPPREARALLEAYGIPLVPERVADTAAEAVAAAVELGLPAVVKSAVPGAHKTETGGVAVGLESEAEVLEAAERIGVPVLVQPLVAGSAELLAGVVQDPVFGPLVAFGPGGVFAELIGQAAFRIAPLTDVDVHELVTEGKASALVRGFRGRPPADAEALEDLLHRLSLLGDDLHEVAELDLNPVIAGPDGCVAVDARIRVARAERRHTPKTW
jgi:acyl-CoA synthetase (NDP forming)